MDWKAIWGKCVKELHWDLLNLPISYEVVALLAIGHLKGPDKFNGGRFSMARTVFDGEYGKPIKL